MKYLWMILFPLMFLPNLGFSQRTQYGMVEIGDWLILPLLIALLLAPSAKYPQQSARLKFVFLVFLAWLLISILSIHFRYDYRDELMVIGLCLLKLGKLVAYTTAGVLIPTRLMDAGTRRAWMWVLILALLAVALGLLTNSPVSGYGTFNREAYKSYNVVIVMMSILWCYLASLWFDNLGSTPWRVCTGIALFLALLSIVFSASKSTHGRGGWMALAIGLGYLFVKRNRRLKSIVLVLLFVSLTSAAYVTIPKFKHVVDITISPPSDEATIGVDDGARFRTWAHEAPKWTNAPLFGTGFYHRGGQSGLWSSGSHNYFIQVLLEAGPPGVLLVLIIFWQMWRSAGCAMAVRFRLSTATRSALVAALVGGISGEYFYSGTVVMALLATGAIVSSLPAEAVAVHYARQEAMAAAARS